MNIMKQAVQFLENEIAVLIKCDEYERALIAGQTVIEIWMDNCTEEEKEALSVFIYYHLFNYQNQMIASITEVDIQVIYSVLSQAPFVLSYLGQLLQQNSTEGATILTHVILFSRGLN